MTRTQYLASLAHEAGITLSDTGATTAAIELERTLSALADAITAEALEAFTACPKPDVIRLRQLSDVAGEYGLGKARMAVSRMLAHPDCKG